MDLSPQFFYLKKITTKFHIYFGQLLGMSDHLTFGLGKAGYKAYKYVPYGPLNEVYKKERERGFFLF